MIHGFCAASIFHKISGFFPLLDKWSDLSWACPRLKILPGGLGIVQRPGSRKRQAGRKGPRFDSCRDAFCTWRWWWRWWQGQLWKQVLVEAQYQVSWGDNEDRMKTWSWQSRRQRGETCWYPADEMMMRMGRIIRMMRTMRIVKMKMRMNLRMIKDEDDLRATARAADPH